MKDSNSTLVTSESNSIITAEAQADALLKLSKQNESTIDSCITGLETIRKSGKITESNFRSISNLLSELNSLRELFFVRLLNSLKRGNMLLG